MNKQEAIAMLIAQLRGIADDRQGLDVTNVDMVIKMKAHYRYDWKRATWITWTTPSFNIMRAWVKPEYTVIKNKAWRTRKFDEYQLEVMFKGHSIMVDYEVAKTDGLLKAVEKAGKEAEGSMKELLRELWLIVKPYRDTALKKEEEAASTPLADARSAEVSWTFKDTAKGIMYAVTFRGQTVYIVKAVVLKHGWKKAIEHAANQSSSENYKELLRGLWRAV